MATFRSIVLCGIACAAIGSVAAADDGDSPQSPPRPRLSAIPSRRDPLRRSAAANAAAADKPATLADPDWLLVPEQGADPLVGLFPPAKNRPHRWRNASVEAIMALPADQRPDLAAALTSPDPISAANAAILLARARDPAAVEPLVQAVEAAHIKMSQRCAVVEVMGDIAAAPGKRSEVIGQLQRLVDAYGQFTGEGQSHYLPELHAELLRALAYAHTARVVSQSPSALSEPRFAAALASPAAGARREAVLALADARFGPLPKTVVRRVYDPDRNVRQAALVVLAARHHPDSLDLIRQAMLDQDLAVRETTMAALGRLGTREARDELHRTAEHGGELLRAAAVEALGNLGDGEAMTTAAAEKSWRVRRVVAQWLAREPDGRTRELAVRLVVDGNSDVARAAIAAISSWPLSDAGPILLGAMEARTFLPRKAAAEQLAARWPPAADFVPEAPQEKREAAMSALRKQWEQRAADHRTTETPKGTAVQQHAPAATAAISREEISEVQQLLAQLADSRNTAAERRVTIQSLIDVGPNLPSILRQLTVASRQPLPETIYREVLPPVSPQFAAVESLRAADVVERRRAADALATQTAQSPLPDLAMERLAALMLAEPDPLVWAGVFAAVARDDREPSIRLAYTALGHPSAEVRRRACEHLRAHPQRRHGALLLASLTDSSPVVVAAAVKALGQLPAVDDPRPLENLLAAGDHLLRVDAAESLVQLRVPSGVPGLERLAYDSDPDVRRAAAQAMGRVPDSLFLPALVRLLDDRPEIRRAALISLPHVAGREVPPAAAIGNGANSPPVENAASEARRWKEWYGQQTTLPK